MVWRLVVFASLNQVALLKRDLYRDGINLEMQRTPQSLSATGCSYALRCPDEQVGLLLERCRKFAIQPGGVFEETEAERNSQRRVFAGDELDQ
jgi:hypothetical protein